MLKPEVCLIIQTYSGAKKCIWLKYHTLCIEFSQIHCCPTKYIDIQENITRQCKEQKQSVLIFFTVNII